MDGSKNTVFCTAIDDLPEEILEHILWYLSPYKDFKSALQVCKAWNRVVKGLMVHKQQALYRALTESNITWTFIPPEDGPTIVERYSHSVCYFDKSMYVFGGCTSTNTTFNDIWRYDLGTRQWIRPLAMGIYPAPKGYASMVKYKDSLILFGGWSHPTPYPLHQLGPARLFNELHIYSPVSNRWTLVHTHCPPLPTAGHSASIIGDGMMVVFGGSHGLGSSCNDLAVLNLQTMTWSKVATTSPKPLARYGQSQIVLDSHHILIVGGCGGPNMQYSDIWLLTVKQDEPWKWKEMEIHNPENSSPQLWCHPACQVGDKVVVLSKPHKARAPHALSSHEPPPQPRPAPSRVWVPPREDQVRGQRPQGQILNSQPGLSAHSVPSKRALIDTSDSSSDDSDSYNNVSAAPSSDSFNDQQVAAPSGEEGGACNVSPSALRAGMPSVRPNAMSNRQKQLEMLRKHEDRLRAQAIQAQHKKSSKFKARKCNSYLYPRDKKNTMQLHVLDVSTAITEGCVTWQPIRENFMEDAPEETIFYSLVAGRGELVMFGGIKTELNSMQRDRGSITHVVSNDIRIISAAECIK
ncbi:F-box only protein 42 [Lingula anatina]|uniref:F-box only protein 42 n=1 Tax=Lingula anatina TaxID=7574 RepID=A0A1S3HGP7_LINAN|nr:F-box only protein 42 [Lingula anatina]|eukprot:XP_013385258.1 F-box only protein 42 [Lingula anatina]